VAGPPANDSKPDRKDRDDLIPSPRSVEAETDLSRAGPWHLVRRLCRAPGADLYEGERTHGRALVQVVLLRPDHDRAPERTEAFIQSVARRTEQKQQQVELLDHGVAHRESGGMALYWAMPWSESAELLSTHGPDIHSMEAWRTLSRELLARLVDRHDRQALDPLLSEAILAVDPSVGSAVLGFPLLIDPRWTDDEMTPPRVAPFEVRERNLALSPSGDLFRLGKALEELARPLRPLPSPVIRWLDRMQQGFEDRHTSARQALQDLDTIDSRGGLGIRASGRSAPRIASAQTVLQGPPGAGSGSGSGQPAPQGDRSRDVPPPEARAHRAGVPDARTELLSEPVRPRADTLEMPDMDPESEPEPSDMEPEGSEQPTVAIRADELERRRRGRSAAPTMPVMPADRAADRARPPASSKRTEPVEPTVEDRDPPPKGSGSAEGQGQGQGSVRADRDSLHHAGPKGTVVGVRLPSPEQLARPLPRDPTPTPDLPPASPQNPYGPQQPAPGGPMMLPPAMLPGVLPPGAMPPGSVPPGSVPPGGHPPGHPPMGPPPGAPNPNFGPMGGPPHTPGGGSGTGSMPPLVSPRPDASEDLPDVQFGNRGRLGTAAAVLGLGIAALVAVEVLLPSVPDDRVEMLASDGMGPQVLRPPRDVSIRVKPATAILVAEMDGTTLGAGRADLLVDADPPVVLVAAPGHVPVRVPLPQRGSVSVELTPSDGESQCVTRVRPPAGVRLEALADSAEQVDANRWSFQGAALFRAVGGRGAWLVPCPEDDRRAPRLKTRPAVEDVQLSIAWPSRGEAFIDGDPQGDLPVTRSVPNGFTRVRVVTDEGEVERWLAVRRDTRVELPDPKPVEKDSQSP
jgi:hypothetical protein